MIDTRSIDWDKVYKNYPMVCKALLCYSSAYQHDGDFEKSLKVMMNKNISPVDFFTLSVDSFWLDNPQRMEDFFGYFKIRYGYEMNHKVMLYRWTFTFDGNLYANNPEFETMRAASADMVHSVFRKLESHLLNIFVVS